MQCIYERSDKQHIKERQVYLFIWHIKVGSALLVSTICFHNAI